MYAAAGSARAPAIHLLEVFVESVKEARAGSVPLKETAAAVAAVRPSETARCLCLEAEERKDLAARDADL